MPKKYFLSSTASLVDASSHICCHTRSNYSVNICVVLKIKANKHLYRFFNRTRKPKWKKSPFIYRIFLHGTNFSCRNFFRPHAVIIQFLQKEGCIKSLEIFTFLNNARSFHFLWFIVMFPTHIRKNILEHIHQFQRSEQLCETSKKH